jgi:hypothetical protein
MDLSAASSMTGPTPALTVGDVIRFTVQGSGPSMSVFLARQIVGSGDFVNFPLGTAYGSGSSQVAAAAQNIATGQPGLAAQAGTAWGVRNFAAGDLFTPPMPGPATTASGPGFWNVRTG